MKKKIVEIAKHWDIVSRNPGVLGMQRNCGNIAVPEVFQAKTVVYLSSKAERKEVRPTFTTGPCLPIILCAVVAHTDLAVER